MTHAMPRQATRCPFREPMSSIPEEILSTLRLGHTQIRQIVFHFHLCSLELRSLVSSVTTMHFLKEENLVNPVLKKTREVEYLARKAVWGHGQTKRHLLPELNDRRGGVLMVIDGAIPPLKCHTGILNEGKTKTHSILWRSPSFLSRFPSYTRASETMPPLRRKSEMVEEHSLVSAKMKL